MPSNAASLTDGADSATAFSSPKQNVNAKSQTGSQKTRRRRPKSSTRQPSGHNVAAKEVPSDNNKGNDLNDRMNSALCSPRDNSKRKRKSHGKKNDTPSESTPQRLLTSPVDQTTEQIPSRKRRKMGQGSSTKNSKNKNSIFDQPNAKEVPTVVSQATQAGEGKKATNIRIGSDQATNQAFATSSTSQEPPSSGKSRNREQAILSPARRNTPWKLRANNENEDANQASPSVASVTSYSSSYAPFQSPNGNSVASPAATHSRSVKSRGENKNDLSGPRVPIQAQTPVPSPQPASATTPAALSLASPGAATLTSPSSKDTPLPGFLKPVKKEDEVKAKAELRKHFDLILKHGRRGKEPTYVTVAAGPVTEERARLNHENWKSRSPFPLQGLEQHLNSNSSPDRRVSIDLSREKAIIFNAQATNNQATMVTDLFSLVEDTTPYLGNVEEPGVKAAIAFAAMNSKNGQFSKEFWRRFNRCNPKRNKKCHRGKNIANPEHFIEDVELIFQELLYRLTGLMFIVNITFTTHIDVSLLVEQLQAENASLRAQLLAEREGA